MGPTPEFFRLALGCAGLKKPFSQREDPENPAAR